MLGAAVQKSFKTWACLTWNPHGDAWGRHGDGGFKSNSAWHQSFSPAGRGRAARPGAAGRSVGPPGGATSAQRAGPGERLALWACERRGGASRGAGAQPVCPAKPFSVFLHVDHGVAGSNSAGRARLFCSDSKASDKRYFSRSYGCSTLSIWPNACLKKPKCWLNDRFTWRALASRLLWA